MPKQYAGYRAWALAWLLVFGASALPAQHLLLSVSVHAGSQCGANISSALDQQGTEARLRAVGFQITNARNAILAHEVDCSVDNKTVAVQQCLALSEFVASGGSRTVQLATRWRECKAYTCAGAECSASVANGLGELEALFATGFVRQVDDTAGPDRSSSGSASALRIDGASGHSGRDGVPNAAIFYICYILVCITVLFRWSLASTHAKHAK